MTRARATQEVLWSVLTASTGASTVSSVGASTVPNLVDLESTPTSPCCRTG